MVSMIARAARTEPGGWAEVKSIALLAPHERLLNGPIDATWIVIVGKAFGFDLSPYGQDHHMLSTVLELARAPLPPNWTLHQSAVDHRTPDGKTHAEGPAAADSRFSSNSMSQTSVYRHVNVITGEITSGHPLASSMLPRLKGIAARASRGLRAKPTDGRLQLADGVGGFYFVDLRSGERATAFPYIQGLAACVLPQRALEPSASRLADAGEEWAAALHEECGNPSAFLEAAHAQLWKPCVGPRAAKLSHEPCPLEAIVLMGHYLGVDACLTPELMWVVDCALSPLMPIGWSTLLTPDGTPYYAHAACGLVQWEHPQTAFLTGVVRRLRLAARLAKNGDGKRVTLQEMQKRVTQQQVKQMKVKRLRM